ncbi:MAG TPA: hypothetical protein ENJ35_05255 [Gammaproteobacteria bacterium]|nr:hypothetical protein [Gammaproteobacteria bacterium]
MKTNSVASLVTGIALLALPLFSSAATLTGKLVGHHCAHEGTLCPADKLDPHITLERDFVLLTQGNEYYFIPNLPRDVKVRHVLDDVVINGDLDSKYNIITARELTVKGQSRLAWSAESQRESTFDYFDYQQ